MRKVDKRISDTVPGCVTMTASDRNSTGKRGKDKARVPRYKGKQKEEWMEGSRKWIAASDDSK